MLVSVLTGTAGSHERLWLKRGYREGGGGRYAGSGKSCHSAGQSCVTFSLTGLASWAQALLFMPAFHGLGANSIAADRGVAGMKGGLEFGGGYLLAYWHADFSVQLAFLSAWVECLLFRGHGLAVS